MKHISLTLCGAAILILLLGCGKDPSSPMAVEQIPVADIMGSSLQSHHCVGWYLVELDTENLELDFIPVARERYDLVIPEEFLRDERMELMLEIIRSQRFINQVLELGGYEVEETGTIKE